MSKIKVLVVDDSAFMRKVIKDKLELDSDIEVVGTARNGQDALDKIPILLPDVITLDVEMPVLDGLETLKIINEKYKCPTIMLSSTTRVGAENTMIALERGAFDFVSKPSGPISLDLHKVQVELIEKVKLAYHHKGKHLLSQSKTKVSDHYKPAQQWIKLEKKAPLYDQEVKKISSPPLPQKIDADLKHLIVIGTSTGGPKALQKVLTSLPNQKQAGILIVQHMPPAFTKSLANRLNQITSHNVREAEDGELIRGGHVYVAPGGYHMEVKPIHKKLAIHLHLGPTRSGHRPSVDVLLESVGNVIGFEIISLIMTGMGKDGTEGLKKLSNQRKVYAIAEDESTCIVYGMPRSVIEAKLVDEICPLDQIHLAIERLIKE